MNPNFRCFKRTDRPRIEGILLRKATLDRYTSRTLSYKVLGLLGFIRHYIYVLVSHEDDEILGTVTLRRKIDRYFLGSHWWIVGLAVAPQDRQGGLGKALVGHAIARLKSMGAERAYVRVLAENLISRCIFEELGFAFTCRTYTFTKPSLGSLRTRSANLQLIQNNLCAGDIPAEFSTSELANPAKSILATFYRRILSFFRLLKITYFRFETPEGCLCAIAVTYLFTLTKVEIFAPKECNRDFIQEAASIFLSQFFVRWFRKTTVDVRSNHRSSFKETSQLTGISTCDVQDLYVYSIA